MRAPDFWHRPSYLGAALTPVGRLFEAGGQLRRALSKPYRASVPVVCVGNLVAGGAGKTPVSIALAALVAARGVAVHLLTRGYGGDARGPIRVEPGRHDFRQVGDEALLLAEVGPTWVARDRAAGAACAVAGGAELIVMDDGFQNPSLVKDLSLLVVDGGYGFGNGRVMPAGPLRESIDAGLARAHAVIMIGADRTGLPAFLDGRLTLIRAQLEPIDAPTLWSGRRAFAFAGIGRPVKFFDTLKRAGAVLAGTREFPDHHPFSDTEIEAVLAEAAALDAVPVTTTKDWVRLPLSARGRVSAFRVGLVWDDEATVHQLLTQVLPS